MTTKMIRVDESYEDKLTSFIHENSEHMEILDDANLEYDAYFYERKKQLDSTIQAIDNGTMKMYSEDEFHTKMKNLEEKLTQKYAD
ncbi:MAG: hypothetical protein COA92_08015 [Sulfurovum sp.]|nr:MAG: hypothetical protein COA92_08015 [Sulfurovum sp.]